MTTDDIDQRLADVRYYIRASTTDIDRELARLGLVTIRDGRVSEPAYVTEPVGCWHPSSMTRAIEVLRLYQARTSRP